MSALVWGKAKQKTWTIYSSCALPSMGQFTWQVLVNVVCLPHTTPPVVTRAHKKTFPGGLRPPRPPQLVGHCRGLRRPGAHGHRFGRPLSRPPKASVWGHVQDQPRSTCLVKMIWVKDQHAQHWPWTLSRWKQGGLAPLAVSYTHLTLPTILRV